MSLRFGLAAVLVVIAFSAPKSHAGPVLQPTAVSTTMGSLSPFAIGNVIDQSGLSPGYTSGVTGASSYTATHVGLVFTAHWQSSVGTTTGFVSFDLGSVQNVNGFFAVEFPLVTERFH